jgi:uncharacterized membrane protein
MGSATGNLQKEGSWPLWKWLVPVLTIIALLLSIIMSWHYLKGSPLAGCGGGSPCDIAMSSRWSTIAGIIPVIGLAIGVYLAMLAAFFFTGKAVDQVIRKLAINAMLLLSGSIIGCALWFIIILAFVVGKFCPYCMATHITGLLISSIVIWRTIKEGNSLKLLFAGAGLAVLLATSQLVFSPAALSPEGDVRTRAEQVDLKTAPVVGSPDAPYIVTLLFDYECPHCQQLHFLLGEVISQYKGKVVFLLCPASLSAKCNPYIPRDVDEFRNSCELARTALAVWKARSDRFADFENWMFTYDSGESWSARSPEDAKFKAMALVGKKRFEAAYGDPWVSQYMRYSVQVYGRTLQGGKGGVPKLIYGSRWVTPVAQSADELVNILQKSLGLPRP